jgi:hypothetical protein
MCLYHCPAILIVGLGSCRGPERPPPLPCHTGSLRAAGTLRLTLARARARH